jgi:hypothetical protein
MLRLINGDVSDFGSLGELLGQTDWTGGEAEIGRYYFFVIRDAPFTDIGSFDSVFRWLTMYVPRFLAPEFKPEDVTYVLWRHAVDNGVFESYASFSRMLDLLSGGGTGSVHPMLWGEMWVNGGWAAIPVFSLILAALCVSIERVLEVVPAVVGALVVPATAVGYLMVARGNSVIGLGYTFYLLPIACAFYVAVKVSRFVVRIDRAPDIDGDAAAGDAGKSNQLVELNRHGGGASLPDTIGTSPVGNR